MINLGFVTGLKAEARCLNRAIEGSRDPSRLLIYCAGGNADRASEGATMLADRGVHALVSFGLAGGLAAALVPGDLVLADAVVLPDGTTIEPDAAWRGRLMSVANARSLPLGVARLAGSNTAVASVDDKLAMFREQGAYAVDMESHAVARVARDRGLPFVALRAIADPAARSIPAIAREGLGPDGQIRALRVVGQLLRQPQHLPTLVRLASDTRAGLTALGRAASVLGAPPFFAYG